MVIPEVLEAAHLFAARALQDGDVAVDATIGNGHDTRFLAEQVGPAGQVFGFDVQEAAVRRTRTRVHEAQNEASLELFHAGHERMLDHLPADVHGDVSAVMFNLGYLPGSDSSCITQPETTLDGLAAAVQALRSGGVVTVVLYTGHDGGAAEANAVWDWAAAQPQDRVHVLSYQFMNQENDPPQLLVLEKRQDGEAKRKQ